LQPLANLPHIKVSNYFTALEASKVSFDEVPKAAANNKSGHEAEPKK